MDGGSHLRSSFHRTSLRVLPIIQPHGSAPSTWSKLGETGREVVKCRLWRFRRSNPSRDGSPKLSCRHACRRSLAPNRLRC